MRNQTRAGLALVVLALWAAGCGESPSSPAPPTPPSPPTPPPAGGGTLILSGTVFGTDATGRRPLAGVTVEIGEPGGAWGAFGRPVTNSSGRYAIGSLAPRHYQARATMAGYDESPVVAIGYLESSTLLDFELVRTGPITGPMTATSIAPEVGSTGGGATVQILGTNFRSGTVVTFDGAAAATYVLNPTTIYAITPAHGAGAVDVKLTGTAGESATLAAGFRDAAPESFDFNGIWDGYALAHPFQGLADRSHGHSDMEMQFTIENNVVTAFTCGGMTVPLGPPPPAVVAGAFALPDASVLSGRIVSDGVATGTINTLACPNTRWDAAKR